MNASATVGPQALPELQEQVERWPELRGHILDREVDADLGAECTQHRGEARGRVDERHVEVEPDHERG